MQLRVQFVVNESTELNKYEGQAQPEILHVTGNFWVTKKSPFQNLKSLAHINRKIMKQIHHRFFLS
jgi:hypothetical protein